MLVARIVRELVGLIGQLANEARPQRLKQIERVSKMLRLLSPLVKGLCGVLLARSGQSASPLRIYVSEAGLHNGANRALSNAQVLSSLGGLAKLGLRAIQGRTIAAQHRRFKAVS